MSDRPGGAPDEEWARIVADLEDVRRAGDRHLGESPDRSPVDAAPGRDAPGDEDPREDDDTPYSPDPGPVTQGLGAAAVLAWTVLVGVPVLLVVLALLPGSLPWWAATAGLAAVLGAIVQLLRSLPEERDDLDDGARV